MSKDEFYLLRRKKSIRLREIADYIGWPIATISLYETDKANFKKNKYI